MAEAPSADSDYEPPSPCISVCVLDEEDVCMGCFRSADEIGAWIGYTPADKREVIKHCNERMNARYGWS